MERDPEPSGQPVPAVQFGGADAQTAIGLAVVVSVQLVQQSCGAAKDPGEQDVGVRIVPNPRAKLSRIAIMEFVGSHHRVDVVPVLLRIVNGHTREASRHVDDQIDPGGGEERLVPAGLGVLDDAVRDGQTDMPLAAGVIRLPGTGIGIEELCRGFVASVAPALPRKRRPLQTGRLRRRPCGSQPAIAIEKSRSGDGRLAQSENRMNEDLVPEDVPAISLAA